MQSQIVKEPLHLEVISESRRSTQPSLSDMSLLDLPQSLAFAVRRPGDRHCILSKTRDARSLLFHFEMVHTHQRVGVLSHGDRNNSSAHAVQSTTGGVSFGDRACGDLAVQDVDKALAPLAYKPGAQAQVRQICLALRDVDVLLGRPRPTKLRPPAPHERWAMGLLPRLIVGLPHRKPHVSPPLVGSLTWFSSCSLRLAMLDSISYTSPPASP
jgi:hypothetical protein